MSVLGPSPGFGSPRPTTMAAAMTHATALAAATAAARAGEADAPSEGGVGTGARTSALPQPTSQFRGVTVRTTR